MYICAVSEGVCNTLEIAKILGRDQRAKNQKIREESNVKIPGTHYLPVVSISTRCSELKAMDKVRKAETWQPQDETQKFLDQEIFEDLFLSKVV